MDLTYDCTMFKETFERDYTWLNGFMRNVRRFGYKPAVIDPVAKRQWTYDEFNADCNRLANALKESGVKKNDIIFVQLYNCLPFLHFYVAAQKIGAIFNPANFNFSPGETAEIITHNRAKVYAYDTEIADTAVKAIEMSTNKPELTIAVNSLHRDFTCPQGHTDYDRYTEGRCTENPPVDFSPHIYDEIVRLQTSGTTGTPKGVPINSINEVLSAHDVIMHFPLNVTDITMNMTPWFHRGGLHSRSDSHPIRRCGAGHHAHL